MNSSAIPLLIEWEKFIEAKPNGDLADFAHWLLEKDLAEKVQPGKTHAFHQLKKEDLDNTAQAALLINRLGKMLNLISKPAIKKAGARKEHEFGALVQIAILDKPNKRELSRAMLIETTTCVEITKRLLQKGLISEQINPDDKRSSSLSVTNKGKSLLQKGYEQLALVYTGFLSALDEQEQETLVKLLGQLEAYHAKKIEGLY